MIWGKKKVDLLTIGDIAVDAFIRIPEIKGLCEVDKKNSKLTLDFADKIPYEFDEIVLATGNAANAVVSASKLGIKSAILSNVGDDQNGVNSIETLEKIGVDTSYIIKHNCKRTNYHYVLWCENERTILVKHEEFPYSLSKIPQPKWIYLTSLGEKSKEYHQEIGEYLKKNPDVRLAFQPGTFQIKLGKEILKDIYSRTDILICNFEEAEKIIGEEMKDPKEIMAKLRTLGPKMIALTKGPAGSFVYDGVNTYFIEEYPGKDAYERTGAGDAYASTFVVSMYMNNSIEISMKLASINSMNVCNYVGAQKGLLSRKELLELLKNAPPSWQIKMI